MLLLPALLSFSLIFCIFTSSPFPTLLAALAWVCHWPVSLRIHLRSAALIKFLLNKMSLSCKKKKKQSKYDTLQGTCQKHVIKPLEIR